MWCIEKEIAWKINEQGCWICTSHAKDRDGYSLKNINGKKVRIHRYHYEKYKGIIPEGIFVCHTCDIPACVNPEHLFLGTTTDNMQDCKAKGRNAHGISHGMTKLTEEQVKGIFLDNKLTCTQLGKIYKISNATISLIKSGKRWTKFTKELAS